MRVTGICVPGAGLMNRPARRSEHGAPKRHSWHRAWLLPVAFGLTCSVATEFGHLPRLSGAPMATVRPAAGLQVAVLLLLTPSPRSMFVLSALLADMACDVVLHERMPVPATAVCLVSLAAVLTDGSSVGSTREGEGARRWGRPRHHPACRGRGARAVAPSRGGAPGEEGTRPSSPKASDVRADACFASAAETGGSESPLVTPGAASPAAEARRSADTPRGSGVRAASAPETA